MQFSHFKKKINPVSKPYHLLGFGKIRAPYEGYFGLNELWIKICWISTEDQQMVFISLDTLYFSSEMTENMFDHFNKTYHLQREQVVFNASHTHSAPNISMSSWDDINYAYMAIVQESIFEGMDHCAKNLKDGLISFQQLEPEKKLFINRRKKVFSPLSLFTKKVKRLPNFVSMIDENIRSITLHTIEQKAEVIIYNFSCHPVFNRNLEYSSDFIGDVSNNIEQHVETAIFLQGFCGDTRANFYGKRNIKTILSLLSDKKHIKRNLLIILKLLLYRNIFIPFTKEYYHYFVKEISETIISNIGKAKPEKHLTINHSIFTYKLFSSTGNSFKKFVTTVTAMNNNLFVSIPAEVNSCYYNLLSSTFKDYLFFPLGYGYDMIGYFPCDNEIDEGGYEVDSFANYGWDSNISTQGLKEYKSSLLENINITLNTTPSY